jgi:hypothetical protein
MPFVEPRSVGPTLNLPQQFWGRYEPGRAEGALRGRTRTRIHPGPSTAPPYHPCAFVESAYGTLMGRDGEGGGGGVVDGRPMAAHTSGRPPRP